MDATDWKQALQDGRVTPNAGVDSAYDKAVESRTEAEAALTVRRLSVHLAVVQCAPCSILQQLEINGFQGGAFKYQCVVWSAV